MPRPWTPTGVTDAEFVKLDEDRRQQIALEIRSKKPSLEVPSAFFHDLEKAIGFFHSTRELAQTSKPSQVRANLREVIAGAEDLREKLTNLDGNSRRLVEEAVDGGMPTLQASLEQLIRGAAAASELADEYSKRGRLPDHQRLCLAVDVASAMKKYLGITPTATKAGTFEGLLTIVLEVAAAGEKKEVTSVNDLVRRALKVQKEADS